MMGNWQIYILIVVGLGFLFLLIKIIRRKKYLVFECEENTDGQVNILYYGENRRNKNKTPRFRTRLELVKHIKRKG